MERAEPTFVPEWLKNAGGVNGGGGSTQHFVSSSHSGVPSLANATRNRSFKSITDFDGHRSSILERTASSNSRRSSYSNGSSPKNPYSNFGRSHRDKDREFREKERSVGGSRWDFNTVDNILPLKDPLRPSRSMVTRKPSDSKNDIAYFYHNGNGAISSRSLNKAGFYKDFPSLGTEDIGQGPSPRLLSAIQSLPIGNSPVKEGKNWSVLAEVPVVMGSNGVGHHSTSAAITATVPVAKSTVTGLNMAEALVHAPTRSQTDPQVSVETRRLEELAIKKSKQLVPMTPSMPKVVMHSSDKLKPKTPNRNSEMIAGPKNGNANHLLPLRGGQQAKPEPPKTSSHSGFLVLKPMRENGVPNAPKDSLSPTNNSNNIVGSSPFAVHPVSSAPISLNNPKLSGRLSTPSPLNLGPASEKKSLSKAKSRIEFFNSMRKKNSVQASSALPEEENKSGDSVSRGAVENGEVASNGDAAAEVKENGSCPNAVNPTEEEAVFLRSLGWVEDEGEEDEGGLTEEEINAFYKQCLALKQSSELCLTLQPRLLILTETYAARLGGAEVSSSNS